MALIFQDPILRTTNSDPSVCRGGGDFYLVSATLGYWPGVPIYHCRDLVNGQLIGHMVNVARSEALLGPYESCPRNPILSHRDDHWLPFRHGPSRPRDDGSLQVRISLIG